MFPTATLPAFNVIFELLVLFRQATLSAAANRRTPTTAGLADKVWKTPAVSVFVPVMYVKFGLPEIVFAPDPKATCVAASVPVVQVGQLIVPVVVMGPPTIGPVVLMFVTVPVPVVICVKAGTGTASIFAVTSCVNPVIVTVN